MKIRLTERQLKNMIRDVLLEQYEQDVNYDDNFIDGANYNHDYNDPDNYPPYSNLKHREYLKTKKVFNSLVSKYGEYNVYIVAPDEYCKSDDYNAGFVVRNGNKWNFAYRDAIPVILNKKWNFVSLETGNELSREWFDSVGVFDS